MFYSCRIGRQPQGDLPSGTDFADVPTRHVIGAAKLTGRTKSDGPSGRWRRLTSRETAPIDGRVRGPGNGAGHQLFLGAGCGRTEPRQHPVRIHGLGAARPGRSTAAALPPHAEGVGVDWSSLAAGATSSPGRSRRRTPGRSRAMTGSDRERALASSALTVTTATTASSATVTIGGTRVGGTRRTRASRGRATGSGSAVNPRSPASR